MDEIFSVLLGYESFRVAKLRLDNLLSIKDEIDGKIILSKIKSIKVDAFDIFLNQKKPLFSKKLNCTFINPGFYILKGKNGIGKSTFIRTLIGLYTPFTEGKILINGINLDQINKKKMRTNNISCLFQDIPLPNCLVSEYIGNMHHENDIAKDESFKKVFYSSQFSINKVLNRKMDELSTGEIQLVKLYSAIIKSEVDCLLLDEPLANIYPELQRDVLDLLKYIAKNKLVIVISHDVHFEGTNNVVKVG